MSGQRSCGCQGGYVCAACVLAHPRSFSPPGGERMTLLALMSETARMRRRGGARWRVFVRALTLWLSLPSDYERSQLASWGTGFTTWEDHGQAACAALNKIAKTWRTVRLEEEAAQ